MKHFRFVSSQGAVGLCFVLAFSLATALLTGCAVFSSPPSRALALDDTAAREADALAFFAKGVLIQSKEARKGTNANLSACADSFLQSYKLVPDNRDVLVALLACCENAQLYSNAYRAAAAYLVRHPDDTALRMDAAHFADASDLSEEAARECETLWQTYPTNREIAVALPRLYFTVRQDAKALDAMRRGYDRYKDTASQRLPIEWAFYFSGERHDTERAIPCMELAISFQTGNVPLQATMTSAIGECLLSQGKTNEALRVWRKAYAMDPDQITSLQLYGNVVARIPERLTALRRDAACPDASDETLMIFAAATQYVGEGTPEKERMFELYRRAYIDSARALRRVYERKMRAGFFPSEQFYTWYADILESIFLFEKRLPRNRLQDASVFHGTDPSLYGRHALVRLLQEAIAVYAGKPNPKNFLAYYWAEQEEHLNEAHKLVNDALRLAPNNAAYLDTKGWILFKMGRPYHALQFLLKACEIAHEAEIFEHTALVLRSLGRVSEAEEFQKALKKEK